MSEREIDPTTALNLALMHWKDADVVTLAERARLLGLAGANYLKAEAEGRVPPRTERRYTSQLATAAMNCGQADRPHIRDDALGPIAEIEQLAMDEQRAERAALGRAPAFGAAKPKELNPNRHDVRLGLIGGGD